jgi:NAD(P)-dependent dehydrogenase (short-subunit alcohol dehydrogenase family)
MSKPTIRGKVVVITGATSGIGRIAAERLAGQGARIVVIARDRERAEAALAWLREVGPDAAHRAHYADLSLVAEVKRAGAEIAAVEPRVDVLINNAGSMFGARKITAEGLERTFALNQHRFRRASARDARLPRSGQRRDLPGPRCLWPLQALQHPVHPRACAPTRRHRRHCELPAPRIRRDQLRAA